jgi:hypothetical protein
MSGAAGAVPDGFLVHTSGRSKRRKGREISVVPFSVPNRYPLS